MPYQIFPGIFSSIDSYSKKITNLHHAARGTIPPWLQSLGDLGHPLPSPHWSKFSMVDAETGITLTGVPDEITRGGDGYWILDYKTARFSNHADSLLPVYRTQLNGYALIAESIGMNPVVGLALIYYEPVTDLTTEDMGTVINGDGFSMGFKANILPIPLDTDIIPPLLRKARDISDLQEPPEGRDGCRDCELLAGLVEMAALGAVPA